MGGDAFPDDVPGSSAPPYGSPQSPGGPPVGPVAGDVAATPDASSWAAGVDEQAWVGTESWDRLAGVGWYRNEPVIDAAGVVPAPADSDGDLFRRVALISAGVAAGVTLVVAGLLGLVVSSRDDGSSIPVTTIPATTPPATTPPATTPPTTAPPVTADVGAALGAVGDSVVAMRTDVLDAAGDPVVGSGVVLAADGLVVTNHHVVAGAERITVVLGDGIEASADFVGAVPAEDLALIRVRGVGDLIPAPIGSSADVQVGEPVVAIGKASDLSGSLIVSSGLVSSTQGTVEEDDGRLQGLIQIDAAIDPGSSGGPLVDAAGTVMGINVANLPVSQDSGFAVPMNRVSEVVERILSGDAEVKPEAFLGVTLLDVADLDEALVVEHGVVVDQGAYVADVVPGTAADEVDVRRGDVIVSIDGTAVAGSEDATNLIAGRNANEVVTIEIRRADQRVVVEPRLGARAG